MLVTIWYLTLVTGAEACADDTCDVSLLQLHARERKDAGARLEAAVAGALGQPLHLRDPEDEGEHPTAHEENKLAQAAHGLGDALRSLPANESKRRIAEAYSQLDVVFRDYLREYYPLGDIEMPLSTSGTMHFMGESDLVGDPLNPSHEATHQDHSAFLFLLLGLVMGIATLHLLSRFAPTIPYTSVLFVEGVLLGALMQSQGPDFWPSMHKSITMWEKIDPHLLFFTFLPVLVFGDAMHFNPHIFRSSFSQIIILACPGVAVGAVLIALVSVYILPYDWDFSTAMAFGAILSATDPVAVVALFKSLGVSPRLTMLISGESVCNDGTAIVLFLLFHKISLGAEFSGPDLAKFLGEMVGIGPFLGLTFGLLTVAWLGLARRKHAEEDGVIQVVLTVVCAYGSFYIAETVFATSGVLTAVSSATVLAVMGLARLNSPHTVEAVWSVFEYVGNTLIFLLAGLIIGRIMVERGDIITRADYLWLLILYILLIVIRAFVVFLFFPVLRLLGTGMTWQEALVSVWAGLRGAVGLALAIIMDIEPRIDTVKGTRIMFMVGGIAALTLLINGSTTRYLLQYLRIGMTTALKEQMLRDIRQRMESRLRKELDELTSAESAATRFQGADIEAVKEALLGVEDAGAEVGQLSEPVLDPDRLIFLREIFLQVCRKTYGESVAEGTLDGGSATVQWLLGSVDEALEPLRVETSLGDWAILERKLSAASSSYKWADAVLFVYPFEFGRDALRQNSSMMHDETMAVALITFINAQQTAQVRVLSFFGVTDNADSPEERQILAESQEQVAKANALLAALPPEAVSLTRSKMLAAKLLESEAEQIIHMDELGIVSERDSVEMLKNVHELVLKSTEVIEEHSAKKATRAAQAGK